MEKVPMTAEGYAALEAEIKHLKTVERPRIIKQIADARTHGDLSENAEYHAAREELGFLEGRPDGNPYHEAILTVKFNVGPHGAHPF